MATAERGRVLEKENTEKKCIYQVQPDVADLNENNILKPYAYQRLFSMVVDPHLTKIDLSEDKLAKYGLAWVLVSLSFEIRKPVEGMVPLYANTWHSGRRGPYFRREFVFRNKDNQIAFQGSSFSILLDRDKRSVYRKKELPFPLIDAVEEITIPASPSHKNHTDFSRVEDRRVRNSDIDCLGHVNNCRYGEFAYDVFTEQEITNLSRLKRMDTYFHSELRLEEPFSIAKAYEGNRIFCRGYNNRSGISFDMIYEFDILI